MQRTVRVTAHARALAAASRPHLSRLSAVRHAHQNATASPASTSTGEQHHSQQEQQRTTHFGFKTVPEEQKENGVAPCDLKEEAAENVSLLLGALAARPHYWRMVRCWMQQSGPGSAIEMDSPEGQS